MTQVWNQMKAVLLMGLLSVLLVAVGGMVGGNSGAQFFFLISLAMNLAGYWWSDKIALAMSQARPVSEQEAPRLYAIVRRLAGQAGLPMPRLYVTSAAQPNAFATGPHPGRAAVAVTSGLLQIMDDDELAGVLAHELAHVKNRDILIGTLAATAAGAVQMIGNILRWGLIFGRGDDEEGGGIGGTLAAIVIAPLVALLLQLAISRAREYQADATGAQIAGSSSGLASALYKLQRAAQAIPMPVSPAMSHMFIVNPLTGQTLASLFSTHPPVQERIRRLQQMTIR